MNYYDFSLLKKLSIQCFLLLFIFTAKAQSALQAPSSFILKLKDNQYLKVQVCTSSIIRFRIAKDTLFSESLMERYNIVKKYWPYAGYTKIENNGLTLVTTEKLIVQINKSGIIRITGKDGKILINEICVNYENDKSVTERLNNSLENYFASEKLVNPIIGDSGNVKNKIADKTGTKEQAVFSFSITTDEKFYGAGSATRKNIQHRGSALKIWATYQKSEAPTPFIMSNAGWGIYNNTTFKNYFDVGRFNPDKLYIQNNSPEVDFYLMTGDNMLQVLEIYTNITGKPYLLPKWAYGLAFGSNMKEGQFDILNNALRFRKESIPCDIYWIEPQWMKKNYDFSINKEWNDDKFDVDYFWLPDSNDPKKENLFIPRMKDLGYKMALWLCIDHDLSIEAEDEISKKSGRPTSGIPSWFSHLNKFIKQGITGFKIDPGRTIDEKPERKYFNSKSDAEMHNLNQVLVQKQMYNLFRNNTGLRSFHHYCGGYAGAQHWGAFSVGDNGGNVKSLYDIINQAMSGNSNVSVDMLEDVREKGPGIHYAFFTPWVQLNSWAWLLHPWYYNDYDKNMFRYYVRLRYSLMPYIYSAAINSSLKGTPIVKPLPLAFPLDKRASEMIDEYMFGDNILVGVFKDSVYLPEGNWIDYWTSKKYKGNQSFKYIIPYGRGGPLFIKCGAIIPYQNVGSFISTKAPDSLIFKIYPEGSSSYTLLEDDAQSYDYEVGKFSSTLFSCIETKDKVEINVGKSQGSYVGQPKNRVYKLEVFLPKPIRLTIDGKFISVNQWKYINSSIQLFVEIQSLQDKKITIWK